MELSIQLIADEPPHGGLEEAFIRHWPSYQRWIARSPFQDASECVAQLREHMPEVFPTFERLRSRFGGDERVGRFLTLYRPPRLVRACSQLVLDTSDGPVLLRTYDHTPRLFDGLALRSEWGAMPTLVMSDCVWGALDGMNGDGLAIALAFGGRNVVGEGFAAPLICRYILETCSSVAAAKRALRRLPVFMPYTFVLLDASGDFVTAFLGPDAEAHFVARRCSTNHQRSIEWPEYARFVETAERLDLLTPLVASGVSIEDARRAFLSPPVWRTDYSRASGTLYVAEYCPSTRSLGLHWPDQTARFDLDDRAGRRFTVSLPEPSVP